MASNQDGMHFAWFTMGGGGGVYYSRKPEGGGLEQEAGKQRTLCQAPAELLVAYTSREGKKGEVWYQLVRVKE